MTSQSSHNAPNRLPATSLGGRAGGVLALAALTVALLLPLEGAPVPGAAAGQTTAPSPPGVADTLSSTLAELPGIEGALDAAENIDAERLLETQAALAHDSMEGRYAGTEGSHMARDLIEDRFRELGLEPAFGDSFRQPFQAEPGEGEAIEAENVAGVIPGEEHPERYMVITAHFDHLGVRDGEIYNGADDNASGTAGILELAAYFQEERPAHTLVFAAMDAEEMGLQGARAFVEEPPMELESVLLNVNLDMVSRSETNELYAAGTHHYPFLASFLHEVGRFADVELLLGYDSPDDPQDWTMASDHGAFHEEGIPFIYFGVEDHPGYHDPSDVFEEITPEFYVNAVETALDFVRLMDRVLPQSVR